MKPGIFLIGVPKGSGGRLRKPTSLTQIGHDLSIRRLERSLPMAFVSRPRSPIEASSLLGVFTFGPPASVYGWYARPVPGSDLKPLHPRFRAAVPRYGR